MSWNDGKGTYWISYDFLGNQQEHSTTLTCPLQESSTLVKSTSKLKEKKDCHVYPFLPDILPNFKRILCQFLAHNLFAKISEKLSEKISPANFHGSGLTVSRPANHYRVYAEGVYITWDHQVLEKDEDAFSNHDNSTGGIGSSPQGSGLNTYKSVRLHSKIESISKHHLESLTHLCWLCLGDSRAS